MIKLSRYTTTDGLTAMQRIEWLGQFQSSKKWLNSMVSEDTKRLYVSYFKRYCDSVGKNPDELIQLKLEGLKHVGEPNEFQAEDLLESFLNDLDAPRNAKKNFRSTVLSFYMANRRSLTKGTAQKFRPTEPKQRRPTVKDIEALDDCMNTQRDKAILWFLASAPCRVRTLTQLLWKDLQPTQDAQIPYKLVIESGRLKGSGEGRYEGLKQIAFIHYYTAQKLENYKRELEQKGYKITEDSPIFIAYRIDKNGNGHDTDEKTIKALNQQTIKTVFDNASLCAFGDLAKKRFSAQDFRSFVDTMLMKARVVEEWRAPIMAHKVKGVEKHYSEPEHSELMEHFRGALIYLIPESKQTREFGKATTIQQASKDMIQLAQTVVASQSTQLESMARQIAIMERIAQLQTDEQLKANLLSEVQAMKDELAKMKRSLKPQLDTLEQIKKAEQKLQA